MSKKAKYDSAAIGIRNSTISGKGVFSKHPIKKGATVCVFDGEPISLEETVRRVNSGSERSATDTLQIGPGRYLDLDAFSRAFNHSCAPNCFVRGKAELVAIRDIRNGEELTYDYSTTMDDNYRHASRSLWTNACNCGAKSCRKSIDQFRFLPQKVQDFYLKTRHAPDFILKKFNKFR